MSKPQVISVPAHAGVGNVPSVQIPLSGTSITLVNLDQNLGLTLCTDDNFYPNTTWPFPAGNAIPQPEIDNLWVQNPNTASVNILVLEGIVPVSTYFPSGALTAGYASLIGPGKLITPGDLTQTGNLIVIGNETVQGALDVTGPLTLENGAILSNWLLTGNGDPITNMISPTTPCMYYDTGGTGIWIWNDTGDSYKDWIPLGGYYIPSTASAGLSFEGAGLNQYITYLWSNQGLILYGSGNPLGQYYDISMSSIGIQIGYNNVSKIGFYGAAPVAQAAAPTSLANLVSILTNLGLCAAGGGITIPYPVTSVFGRTGIIVPASGDYTVSEITGAAPLASPALTGTPTAPTQPALTNNTDIATTAYTDAAVGVETSRATGVEALKAPLASPALTGTPTAPTQPALTNNTDIATTAYTDAAVGVETSRATTAEALKVAILNASYAGKNAIINGGMDIWQRGTSFAIPSTSFLYTADRWDTITGASASQFTVSQITAGVMGLVNAMRVQRNSGSTAVNVMSVSQSLESVNSIPFAGQTVTLSFWARCGTNYSASGDGLYVEIDGGTGTDQNALSGFTGSVTIVSSTPTLTTSWQRFSYTGTVGAPATQVGLYFGFAPTGTAGTNDYFDITGVQLELGSVATPFSRAGGSIGGELALCQRYYYQMTGIANSKYGLAQAASATTAYLPIAFPVQMRIVPTLSTSAAANFSQVNAGHSALLAVSTIGTDTISNQVAAIQTTCATGLTAGNASELQDSGSGNSYLAFSAEL